MLLTIEIFQVSGCFRDNLGLVCDRRPHWYCQLQSKITRLILCRRIIIWPLLVQVLGIQVSGGLLPFTLVQGNSIDTVAEMNPFISQPEYRVLARPRSEFKNTAPKDYLYSDSAWCSLSRIRSKPISFALWYSILLHKTDSSTNIVCCLIENVCPEHPRF